MVIGLGGRGIEWRMERGEWKREGEREEERGGRLTSLWLVVLRAVKRARVAMPRCTPTTLQPLYTTPKKLRTS